MVGDKIGHHGRVFRQFMHVIPRTKLRSQNRKVTNGKPIIGRKRMKRQDMHPGQPVFQPFLMKFTKAFDAVFARL